MKKKRPLSILKDKLPNGNPFDYLLALKEGGMQAVYEEEFIEGLGDEGEKVLKTDVDSEIDICEQIRRLAESRVIVPRDLRVDDGDIPTAKNFYEWCTQDRFGTIGDERPFIEQMIWGLIAFNEVCYTCSDIEWLIHDHKVDDTFAKLERKVQLLEYGVCPACGVGRSQAFKEGLMPFYNELAINAGQRCVIGTTPILTPQGIKHISEMYPDAPEGFSEFNAEVYNGKWLERTSHFFKAKPEPVTRLTTDTGFCVVGTKDHPIKSGSEFVTLYDLEPGAPIPIYVGTQVFGQDNYQNAYQLGTQFYDSSVPQHVRQFDQSSTHEWLKGVFRSRMHAFVTDTALRDVSAMLLNAGFMHSIDGPAIVMTEQQHQDLLANNPQTFVYQDKVKSLEIEGEAETYDFTLPSTHQFITGGLLSHNSGKSHTLGTYLYPYYNHRLMKLQSPPTFYGLSRTTRLQGTFAALTFTQAKDTLWTPFYGAITQTSWYKQYHGMLRHYGNVYGEKLFKLNENFVDYRARALFWHPMSPDLRVMRGRCTRFATILNTNGGFYHAGELIKKTGYHEVKNITIDSHVGQQEVSHTYKDRSETIKVKTRNGYSIEGTPEHPMLVLTPNLKYKWVPLDEMKVGDWIVSRTPKNAPMFGTNDAVSKDMATIMGYYVANGHKNFIATSDGGVIKNMYAVYNRITGCTPTFCIGEGGVRSHTHYLQLERQGVFVRDYLRPLGITSKNSLDKFIPLSVRTAPFEVFHEFMEAYFECDSGVNGGGDNGLGSTRSHEIEVGSASYKLAYQLHILLLHAYGIVGRLQKQVFFDKQDKKTGLFNAKRTHWLVSITGYDAGIFLRTFKRAKVQNYRHMFNNTPAGFMSDRRSVPFIRNHAIGIYAQARLGNRFVREDGSIYSPRKDGKLKMPSFVKNHRPNLCPMRPLAEFAAYGEDWDELLPIMDQFDSERTRLLAQFLGNGAHYEEVTEITFRKKKSNVYDVTVPGTHAFTANGLVSHNTRVAASIDEIAYFDADKDTKKVTIGGHEIYDALANSLATVRTASEILLERGYDDVFPAYMMNVTSPVSKADMIHILLERAKNSKSIFGISRATWEVNPNFKRNSQFITEQYRRDPISADRNFGANPPAVSNPFFTNHKQIQDCESDHKNLIKVAPVLKKSKKLGQGFMYGELVKVKKSGKASLLALDAGMVDNSFSLVLGSTDSYNLTIDLVCEIMTVPGYPINFTKMYDELILPLMRARNVKVLLADRWNSKMLLDTAMEDMADYDAEEDSFLAETYSLKYQDFVSIKTLMEMGRLKLPKSEMKVDRLLEATDSDYREFYNEKPIAHLFKQLYTVKDLTKTVGKGDGYTDDSFRAMALCVHGLQSEKYEILLSQEQFNMEVARPSALGASRLYSGGGGTVGSGSGGPTMIGGAPIGMIGKGRGR